MNKNPQISVDRVRRLLEAYYAAETSDADERVLADFFAATPPDALPADLLADAHLFAAFAQTSAEVPSMPPGLETSVAAAIDRSVSRRRVVPALWWSIVASAAAIALFLIPTGDVVLQPDVAAIAHSLAAVDYKAVSERVEVESVEPETPKKHVYRNPRRMMAAAASETIAENDPTLFELSTHTEVTDPDKAASIARRALRSVAMLSGTDRVAVDENTDDNMSFAEDDNNFGEDEL